METLYDLKEKNKQALCFLMLSVLVHLMILHVSFRYMPQPLPLISNTYNSDTNITQDKELPAALRAGSSHFGIPINWTEPELDVANAQQADVAKAQENKVVVQENTESINQPTEQVSDSKSNEPKNNDLQENVKTSIAAQIVQKTLPAPNIDTKNIESFTSDTAETKTAQQNIATTRISIAQTHTKHTETGTQNAPQAERNQRTLTLADLANGFLDSIRSGGEDLANRAGDPNKRPDTQELQKLNYLYSIVWYMQNEWRIKAHTLKVQSNEPFATAVKIVIARDGALHYVAVVESSGTPEYDAFVLKGIKRASPYPPVPKFIKTDFFDATVVFWFYPQQPNQAQVKPLSFFKNKP